MLNTRDDTNDRINLYIKFLKERLAFQPCSATLHYNLGLAYAHKGLNIEAISEFKQAIECDPNLAEAYVNLAGLYAEAEPAKSIEANRRIAKDSFVVIEYSLRLGDGSFVRGGNVWRP